ncbi:MAG: membrane protein insertion efficiency factor YidD [Eubacteriaceae bacterium]
MINKIILKSIEVYRKYISPLTPGKCRFYPTCSEYCYEAFKRYGVKKGFVLSINRIKKCHPFHPGGYDPLK